MSEPIQHSAEVLLKNREKAELNPFDCSGRTAMALLDELIATASVVSRGS